MDKSIALTWIDYHKQRETRIPQLLTAFKSGNYRAPNIRRVYIPKGDGKLGMSRKGKRSQCPYKGLFSNNACYFINADMKGYIYSHKILIGTTIFKNSFGAMGHIWGEFIPSEEYQVVKKQVQEFCDSMKKDYKGWDSFRFNIQLGNGYFLLPIGGIEILDSADFPDEPINIHVAGVHSHIYIDYFENNRAFVITPWQPVNIDQKIELEDELSREIGETNVTFSTLAKHSLSNEVLFAIHGDNVPPFVIANLKPGQKVTIEDVFPDENYFMDFELVQERIAKDLI